MSASFQLAMSRRALLYFFGLGSALLIAARDFSVFHFLLLCSFFLPSLSVCRHLYLAFGPWSIEPYIAKRKKATTVKSNDTRYTTGNVCSAMWFLEFQKIDSPLQGSFSLLFFRHPVGFTAQCLVLYAVFKGQKVFSYGLCSLNGRVCIAAAHEDQTDLTRPWVLKNKTTLYTWCQ